MEWYQIQALLGLLLHLIIFLGILGGILKAKRWYEDKQEKEIEDHLIH